MKQFALIFRMNLSSIDMLTGKEQMELYMKDWTEWISGIADKKQLANGGNHFSNDGIVIKPGNKLHNGPYESNSESIAGYILILAKNMDDAISIAEKCPILNGEGTSVEIRETGSPGGTSR